MNQPKDSSPPANAPRHAMVMAAGLGTRMRPLTDGTAKALLQLQGRALLDHALDRLAAVGVRQVVVNAHWQAKAVADHLAGRVNGPAVRVLDETTLEDGLSHLETYAREMRFKAERYGDDRIVYLGNFRTIRRQPDSETALAPRDAAQR